MLSNISETSTLAFLTQSCRSAAAPDKILDRGQERARYRTCQAVLQIIRNSSRHRPTSASLIGHCCQAPHLVPVFVSTAWVTLLYVVGPAMKWAITSIGRIGLERLALGPVSDFRLGLR